MGFFSGGGNSGAQNTTQNAAQIESNRLVEKQIQQNQAETEEKKKAIYKERLSIIHGQSGQQWNSKGQ